MNNLSQMEIHINKATNTIRIFSILTICITVAFLLGISIGDNKIHVLIIAMIFSILGFGISLMIISEVFWKILIKFGSTEERLFYFYNFDKKRFD